MSKISVIIPVYNVEKYLEECLDSVINQTYKNLEIICVDDCGQDNSFAILEKYAKIDSRIKIIKHEQNKGVGPARNTGINNATGDYIFFLDSDDYLELDILEVLYKKIKETNVDFTMIRYKDNINELIEYSILNNKIISTNHRNFSKVLNNMPILAWGKLFNTKFLKNHNLKFIDNNAIHEDDGFTIKLLSAYPTYSCIDRNGFYYRKNPNSIMNTLKKEKSLNGKKLNLEDAINYIKNNCKDEKQIIRKVKRNYRYSKYTSKFNLLYRFIWEKYNKHIEICFVTLIKQKVKSDVLITNVLGINVAKKKLIDLR